MSPASKKRQHSASGQRNGKFDDIARHHIDSFDYFLTDGLANIVRHLEPLEFSADQQQNQFFAGTWNSTAKPLDRRTARISLSIKSAVIESPTLRGSHLLAGDRRLFPSECRQRKQSYLGALKLVVECRVNERLISALPCNVGDVPVMVRSVRCHLAGLPAAGLVERGEDPNELGGYFLSKGSEKVIRLLIMTRRNYPLAMVRDAWKKRGLLFTQYGCHIRSIRSDECASMNYCHYLSNGQFMMGFAINREQFFMPLVLVLKSLCRFTDLETYRAMTRYRPDDKEFSKNVKVSLRNLQKENLLTRDDCLKIIGKNFRVKFVNQPPWKTDWQIGNMVLERYILIHLDQPDDKFHLACYMANRAYSVAVGECAAESPDSLMFQDVLLPGHLFMIVLALRWRKRSFV